VLDEKSKKSVSGCPRKVFVVDVSRDFRHVAVRAASQSEKSRKLVSRCEGRARFDSARTRRIYLNCGVVAVSTKIVARRSSGAAGARNRRLYRVNDALYPIRLAATVTSSNHMN
jgi:heterodisulfide reductase subunit C